MATKDKHTYEQLEESRESPQRTGASFPDRREDSVQIAAATAWGVGSFLPFVRRRSQPWRLYDSPFVDRRLSAAGICCRQRRHQVENGTRRFSIFPPLTQPLPKLLDHHRCYTLFRFVSTSCACFTKCITLAFYFGAGRIRYVQQQILFRKKRRPLDVFWVLDKLGADDCPRNLPVINPATMTCHS